MDPVGHSDISLRGCCSYLPSILLLLYWYIFLCQLVQCWLIFFTNCIFRKVRLGVCDHWICKACKVCDWTEYVCAWVYFIFFQCWTSIFIIIIIYFLLFWFFSLLFCRQYISRNDLLCHWHFLLHLLYNLHTWYLLKVFKKAVWSFVSLFVNNGSFSNVLFSQ